MYYKSGPYWASFKCLGGVNFVGAFFALEIQKFANFMLFWWICGLQKIKGWWWWVLPYPPWLVGPCTSRLIWLLECVILKMLSISSFTFKKHFHIFFLIFFHSQINRWNFYCTSSAYMQIQMYRKWFVFSSRGTQKSPVKPMRSF